MDPELRESKERFISQLTGTTFSELSVVTFVVPVRSIPRRSCLHAPYARQTSYFAATAVIELVSRNHKLSALGQYALEFTLIVMPCLLAVNYPLSIARLLGVLLLLGFASIGFAAW